MGYIDLQYQPSNSPDSLGKISSIIPKEKKEIENPLTNDSHIQARLSNNFQHNLP